MTSISRALLLGAALAAAPFATAPPAHAALLEENFNDGLGSTRWSVASQQEARSDGPLPPDGSANLAFDYSTLGIANPDGGSDTIGAFLQVNKTDQTGDEGETYIIYPTGMSFSGDLLITADMYVWNDGAAASTELGVMGLFLDNSDPVAPYQWGTRGGPLAWAYTGEGGSTADFAAFKEGGPSSTGYVALADYPAGPFTDPLGPAASNANGSWVDVAIQVQGSMITWMVNGVVVDTYDNSGGFYTMSNIFFGTSDPFNSSNGNNGAIIDNVVVNVPEPVSLSLLAFGLLMTPSRRR